MIRLAVTSPAVGAYVEEDEAVAVRAHIAEIERQIAQQPDLGRQVPLLEPRNFVLGAGNPVGELRGDYTKTFLRFLATLE